TSPIRVYVLTEKLYFIIASFDQTARLLKNPDRRARTFASASERDDAEAAEIVAPFDYRNESYIRRLVLYRADLQKVRLFGLPYVDRAGKSAVYLFYQIGQLRDRMRPDYHTHFGRLFEYLFRFGLRNTTHNAYDRFRSSRRFDLSFAASVLQFSDPA